jgi:hypothetical protein
MMMMMMIIIIKRKWRTFVEKYMGKNFNITKRRAG